MDYGLLLGLKEILNNYLKNELKKTIMNLIILLFFDLLLLSSLLNLIVFFYFYF